MMGKLARKAKDKVRHFLRHPWKLFLVLFAGYIVVVSLAGWITKEWANVIYFATGAIVLWYTVETHAMRRETTRQAELAVRPAVLARIEDNPDALILRNIGNGPALYVKLEDIEFETIDYATGRGVGKADYIVTFATTPVIEAKADVPATVQLERYTGQGSKPVFDYLAALDSRYQKNFDFPVLIHYKDLYGGLHRTLLEMGKSGTQFIGFESGDAR